MRVRIEQSLSLKKICDLPRVGLWAGAVFITTLAPAAEAPGGISEQPLAPRSGPRGATMFKVLSAQETGIVTENRYSDPKMWAERHRELELGSVGTGVAIGDYDNDGRPDIFVVSKTEGSHLFRNLGGWKFEEVTEKAGVADHGDAAGIWKQGVTFADVNNDGRLDIYVCRFGAPNLLYINQGDGTFKEEAAARGLAVNDASVMAAFCDYDRDGWLDVFVQTNLFDSVAHPQGQRNYLFHNNGDGTFSNVTDRAGITGEGQGHSATWWDYDDDGWPDLYVANDFLPADKLYRNNRDGTFTNVIDHALPHTPFSSMGSDLGDINNDGKIDLLVADMAATTHEKDQRAMAATRGLATDPKGQEFSSAQQYLRNALYLGTGTDRCLEAAFLTGLAATDWTWSVRWEDLDNDGRLDLFVTNGMFRESHNTDLMARMTLAQSPAEKVQIKRSSPVLNEANLAFRNQGDYRFEDVSALWGLNEKGVSFGAAFGDLDGDGDLDLVYANYQKGVTVLRNDSVAGHRVIFALRGTTSNRFGVGAKLRIETATGIQVRQLVLARGVLSNSEPVLHFGLGEDDRIKHLSVEWPSGQTQSIMDLAADRKYTVTEPRGAATSALARKREPAGMFREVSQEIGCALLSRESAFDELAQQPLLPQRQNRRGPSLVVGDINGTGQDDAVLGGTPSDPARLLRAGRDGHFVVTEAAMLTGDGPLSDGPMLLFEANGDGHPDLLVSKGGSARPAGSPDYQPQLFLNDGRGGFRAAPSGSLPPLPFSVGALVAADYDRSGRLGVFVGSRVLPGQYPFSPRSALLVNRDGRFEDVTDTLAPGLREVGMVTAALWSDVDQDGWPDLLLTIEWGQVKYFHNNQGKGFEDWTERAGFAAAGTGWWTSIAAADFNGDGRCDYAVGNLGLNTQYQADPAHPALLYAGDFKGDDTLQLVEGYFEGERLFPWRTRRALGAAVPSILKRFPRNDFYARATLGEILGEPKLAAAQRFAATEFRSGVFLSQPDGTYHFEPLPRLAQIAPLQGLAAGDFDGDGRADIYAVQNSYAPIAAVGRFDGGLSQLLRGDGHGHFSAVPLGESNLVVPGDAKALAVLDLDQDSWPDFLVTRNNSTTLAFRNNGVAGRHMLRVSLHGPAGNPAAVGARITLALADGSKQSGEVYAGSGYYSQSAAAVFFGWTDTAPIRELIVRWPSGQSTTHSVPLNASTLTLTAPRP
jgi:enediyne biosynthesis protein E4